MNVLRTNDYEAISKTTFHRAVSFPDWDWEFRTDYSEIHQYAWFKNSEDLDASDRIPTRSYSENHKNYWNSQFQNKIHDISRTSEEVWVFFSDVDFWALDLVSSNRNL